MNRLQRQRKDLFLVLALGVGLLIWPERLLGAERTDPAEPYRGLRESTLRYIALGTPDDLLRLHEALETTEQEIVRLRLEIAPEKQEQFVEKHKRLAELRDRLAESQALLQLLESSSREITKNQLDPSSAKERELLRKELSSGNDDLKKNIGELEKEIRSGQTEYLRTLEEERKALALLLAVRREWLLAEYQGLSGCTTDDRPCLARKVKILCRLSPLFPSGSRAPILILLEEASGRLSVGSGSTSSLCDYLKHDFAP